jgi:hypothetical protein
VLRTSFVAVPAFIRVEPAIASGPTIGVTATSASRARPSGGGGKLRIPILAPRTLASASAAWTKGVVADAAIPSTKSSGDHASHELRVRAEGGGAFRRVEDAEASARARPDVDQPTPYADPPLDLVDQASDRLRLAGHGRGDTSILGVDQLDDLPDRGSIDPRRGGVAGFGQTRVLPQIDSSFAG